jgi:tRNA(fMet)-specific endonuclease VapC
MNGKYLLDTNIVIALFGNDPYVVEQIDKAEKIFIPVIVVGELYYGAIKSRFSKRNLEKIETFINSNTILGCDKETARFYGNFKKDLKVSGKPIPENDIWIAAIAAQYKMSLITRDEHFHYIKDLKIKKW